MRDLQRSLEKKVDEDSCMMSGDSYIYNFCNLNIALEESEQFSFVSVLTWYVLTFACLLKIV